MTLTPYAERLAVELSLPVLTIKVCHGWDSNSQPSFCGANALTHCATASMVPAIIINQLLVLEEGTDRQTKGEWADG